MKPGQNCYRCECKHIAQLCFFINKEFYICHKQGHIAKMCIMGCQKQCSKQRMTISQRQMHHVVDNVAASLDEEDIHRLLRLTNSRAKPIQITVSITSCSGHEIKVLATLDVEVNYIEVDKVLPLLIVEDTGPSLLVETGLRIFD